MQKARDGFIGGQFIEVIEWIDGTADTMIHKFGDADCQIKNGAQLTVRESQAAVFVNEGQIADVFTPGRYTLATRNIPVLSSLKGWKYGFESPFKADVYFVNTKQFTGFRWGTANPILTRDQEFGAVRLRAFGTFAFRVTDPARFLRDIAGTNPNFTAEGVQNHLRSLAVSVFTDTLVNQRIPALDLSSKYLELGRLTLGNARQRFDGAGLAVSGFTVENISLTEEVERHVDKRSSMNAVGDLDTYAKFQMADSIPEAMANPGGAAGLGAGLALGQEIAKALGGTLAAPRKAAGVPSNAACPSCGASLPPGSMFCMRCGVRLSFGYCSGCGEEIVQGAKFCAKCGSKH
jgi:membrane protease subunit (stomatin/prohibitin family)